MKSRYATKKKGKTEVYPFWNMEDIKKMMDWFKEMRYYDEYLIFMFGLLLGRRIGDTVSMKWSDIFYENGTQKMEINTIEEQKTGKTTIIPISQTVFEAVEKYCKYTGIVLVEHINEYIFNIKAKTDSINRKESEVYKKNDLNIWCEYLNKDFSEKRKQAILNDFEKQKEYDELGEYLYNVVEFMDIVKWQVDGFRRKFDRAAKVCEIKTRVSCHSLRKTFGWISKLIHPFDPNCMETLQDIFNYSDVSTTMHYIGLSEQRKRVYFEDMGEVVKNIENGDTELRTNNSPIVSLKHEDLRQIIMYLIKAEEESEVEKFNEAMNMIDTLKIKSV